MSGLMVDFCKNENLASDINGGYHLGKGEVVSSILTGSTRKAHEIEASGAVQKSHSAETSRTKRETGGSNGGLRVDSVRETFPN